MLRNFYWWSVTFSMGFIPWCCSTISLYSLMSSCTAMVSRAGHCWRRRLRKRENDLSLVMQLANLSVIHLIKETGQQLHPSLKSTSREIVIYLVNNRMFCLLKDFICPPTHTLFFKPPLKQMFRNVLHIWRHNYCFALQSWNKLTKQNYILNVYLTVR